jgi:hypothetical protein
MKLFAIIAFPQSKSKNQNTTTKAVLPLSINNENKKSKRTPEGCKGVPKRQSVNTENVDVKGHTDTSSYPYVKGLVVEHCLHLGS